MRILFLSIVLAISGCATGAKLDETEKLFSATFVCPKDGNLPSWVEPVSMRKMAGVYVMTSDISDRIEAVRGKVRYVSVVLDGVWRSGQMSILGKTYAIKIMGKLLAKNKVQFSTKYPSYINLNKEKVKAGSSVRTVTINQNGDWVRDTEKQDSPICKRQ